MPVGPSTYRAARLAHALREASATPGAPSLWARMRAVPRMVRAVRSGQYTGLTSTRLMMLLAGIGYVVSPIDLVPEGLLLVVGLVDDVLVIGWVATVLLRETEDFIVWERDAAAWAAQHGRDHADRGARTVPSYVVPD
ncbi:YkvA family protein [Janibacter alittae]|uniref:YkvA family protein n=1 Tax=Janibacter alittae TaxID=3115209 RepID=A0ABZ2MKT1_9MICO